MLTYICVITYTVIECHSACTYVFFSVFSLFANPRMSVMVSYVDCGWTWKKKNCCNNPSTGLGMHSADHSSVFGGEGAGLSLCQFSESYLKVWILRMAQIVVMVVSSEFWISRLSNESALWCRGLVHVPSIHCCRNLVDVFRISHLWRRSCVHEFWTGQQSTLYAEALSWTNEQSPSHGPCAEALYMCLEQVNMFCRAWTAACRTTTSRELQHLCSTSATTGRSFLPFSSEGTTLERSKRRPFFLFSWAVFPPVVKHRCG